MRDWGALVKDTMIGGALLAPIAAIERLSENFPWGSLASALSRLNFRVEPLQFNPCFVDRELPIDGPLLLIDAG
jgi:hypothetical protein